MYLYHFLSNLSPMLRRKKRKRKRARQWIVVKAKVDWKRPTEGSRKTCFIPSWYRPPFLKEELLHEKSKARGKKDKEWAFKGLGKPPLTKFLQLLKMIYINYIQLFLWKLCKISCSSLNTILCKYKLSALFYKFHMLNPESFSSSKFPFLNYVLYFMLRKITNMCLIDWGQVLTWTGLSMRKRACELS